MVRPECFQKTLIHPKQFMLQNVSPPNFPRSLWRISQPFAWRVKGIGPIFVLVENTQKHEEMLELCKRVLSKVSFDRQLFAKELRKSVQRLGTDELRALRDWCLGRYGHCYSDLIEETFGTEWA